MSERAGVFIRLAHIDDFDAVGDFLECVRLDFPNAAEGKRQRRPLRVAVVGLRADGLTAQQVGGHCDVDLLGMRQIEVMHIAGKIVHADVATQPRVETPFLLHIRHRDAAVIVRGVKQTGRGQ